MTYLLCASSRSSGLDYAYSIKAVLHVGKHLTTVITTGCVLEESSLLSPHAKNGIHFKLFLPL